MHIIAGIDPAAYSYALSQLAAKQPHIAMVVPDAESMQQLAQELRWLLPKTEILTFPAWDVQPYDRVAPATWVQAARLHAVAQLESAKRFILLTTVNAATIKLPAVLPSITTLNVGETHPPKQLMEQLGSTGYQRVGTVQEPGEFAVRGNIMDIYSPLAAEPYRIDFFDDEIESIHSFDPLSQRRSTDKQNVQLPPAREIVLDEERIATFRQNYRETFSGGQQDLLYEQITNGQAAGLAWHFLPLFFKDKLPHLWHFLPPTTQIIMHPHTDLALETRSTGIYDAFTHRQQVQEESYRPVLPDWMYVNQEEWQQKLDSFTQTTWQSLAAENAEQWLLPEHLFLTNTANREQLHQAVQDKVTAVKGWRVVLTAQDAGRLEQLENMLPNWVWQQVTKMPQKAGYYSLISPLAHGFTDTAQQLLVITAQDVLGDRHRPQRKKRSKAQDFTHFSELNIGDFVIHEDHGVARFDGLMTLTVADHTQEFMKLSYQGEDKLFVPIEQLHVISRYSSAEAGSASLDKLGGAAWQAKKARVKEDLMAMADDLLAVAATRVQQTGFRYPRPDGLYDEFCATFPYELTTDQHQAIQDVENDLSSDQAMDRLVVGDVGFGKTEVALRAAFYAAAAGKQVAVVVPTTLLARQHYALFQERFKGFPINLGQLSRLVSRKDAETTKTGLKNGTVDIVVGTHAVFAKNVQFKDLGLIIIDEEQRFGVAHKEKLKAFKAETDVLTLTATPIPRTLQMALGGLRGLSLITTPPVDRLAVNSFVMPFDSKVLREAMLRETMRGGQVYVVTPKVRDIEKLAERLKSLLPQITFGIAHGQLSPEEIENVMHDFYDGKTQVLIATSIIENGLDVPRANTLIIHNADRFGLSQLYQLRGRIGRGKVRGYAYFLLPDGPISEAGEKRLRILQRLEGLGAGFTLANYDMDMRGFGNLLGKQQSGHIKEVGFELYTRMLAEAVQAKQQEKTPQEITQAAFTPTLNLGLTYLIPEHYVADLNTRLQLYRRLAHLNNTEALQDFEQELIDRFGPIPTEVTTLLGVMRIRNQCQNLNIIKLDAGAKGAVIEFYQNTFAKPENLLGYVMQHPGQVTLRPDQTIVFHRAWANDQLKLSGVNNILAQLYELTQAVAA